MSPVQSPLQTCCEILHICFNQLLCNVLFGLYNCDELFINILLYILMEIYIKIFVKCLIGYCRVPGGGERVFVSDKYLTVVYVCIYLVLD